MHKPYLHATVVIIHNGWCICIVIIRDTRAVAHGGPVGGLQCVDCLIAYWEEALGGDVGGVNMNAFNKHNYMLQHYYMIRQYYMLQHDTI